MNVAVVIPVGRGRQDNLKLCLAYLAAQTSPPDGAVLVCDGEEARVEAPTEMPFPVAVTVAVKHEPGREQPRNLGVRLAEQMSEDFTHAWFLDSDVIVAEDALEKYHQAMSVEPEPRILVGPYEWMGPGVREPQYDLHTDPRQPSFQDAYPWKIYREDLSAGLACFSGNLVWPIDKFKKVGGFWNELHHGRCEDGELGLRAVAMGVPISFVPEARGWHLYHDINYQWVIGANTRDVPMLNARHPWVEGEGLLVVEEDGRRFNARCAVCGEEFNSMLIWEHQEQCAASTGPR